MSTAGLPARSTMDLPIVDITTGKDVTESARLVIASGKIDGHTSSGLAADATAANAKLNNFRRLEIF